MDKDLAYILIGTEEIAKRTAEIGARVREAMRQTLQTGVNV